MDKKLKILLDKVKESDPNLNTMDYLLLNLAKKLSGDDILRKS